MPNELVIFPLLKAFIENEFRSMLKTQRELERRRKTVLPKLRAKEQREHKRDKRAERKSPDRIYYTRTAELKGKGKHYLNIFIYMCDYLICKENQETIELKKRHRKDVHLWISNFLHRRQFKKDNGKPYTSNDIRRIITNQFENSFEETRTTLKLFRFFVDDMFSSFCNPTRKQASPDPNSVKPIIWEI